jgi:hypothetical protein
MNEIIWIPIVMFLISLYLIFRAVKQRNSGTVKQNQITGRNDSVPGKVPLYKIGIFLWGVGLFILSIVVYFIMQGEK